MSWRIFKYIQHLFCWKHRKGHGIHSPYVFEFVNRVIFNSDKTEVPIKIRNIHRELKNNPKVIPEGKRKIRSFVRGSSVTQTYGSLLYRIAKWVEPDFLLELGTGLGVSTLYLGSGLNQLPGAEHVPVHTIEGNASRAAFAEKLFKRFDLSGVKVHCGEVDEHLLELKGDMPGRFLAFVDANHSYEPTIRYVKSLIPLAGEEAIVVMDDIYWSKGMYRAWKELISIPEVRVSVDLFHMGILLLRKDLHKTHYKIKF